MSPQQVYKTDIERLLIDCLQRLNEATHQLQREVTRTDFDEFEIIEKLPIP